MNRDLNEETERLEKGIERFQKSLETRGTEMDIISVLVVLFVIGIVIAALSKGH